MSDDARDARALLDALETERARGDAWRAKFDEDTTLLVRLKAERDEAVATLECIADEGMELRPGVGRIEWAVAQARAFLARLDEENQG